MISSFHHLIWSWSLNGWTKNTCQKHYLQYTYDIMSIHSLTCAYIQQFPCLKCQKQLTKNLGGHKYTMRSHYLVFNLIDGLLFFSIFMHRRPLSSAPSWHHHWNLKYFQQITPFLCKTWINGKEQYTQVYWLKRNLKNWSKMTTDTVENCTKWTVLKPYKRFSVEILKIHEDN